METPLLPSVSDTSSSSPSSSSSEKSVINIADDHSTKYDVFLSFTSEDTDKNTMRHLRAALSEKGMKVFADRDQTPRDEYISPELARAIEDSRCSVVILSASYASSSRCLEELVKILECVKRRGQALVPVLCRVDGVFVRERVQSFAERFGRRETTPLEDRFERVHRWRVAVTQVTGLPALDTQNYRDEAHFIEEIISEVALRLKSLELAKNAKNNRSCIRRIMYPRGYGVSTCIGFTGAILVTFFVLFPIYGMFVFVVGPRMFEMDEENILSLRKNFSEMFW